MTAFQIEQRKLQKRTKRNSMNNQDDKFENHPDDVNHGNQLNPDHEEYHHSREEN